MLLCGDCLIRLLIRLGIKEPAHRGRLFRVTYQNAASNGANNINKRSNAASNSCGM